MITLFGQQVYSAKAESIGFGNGSSLKPLLKDIESVECREFHHSIRYSRIEVSSTNGFGKRSEKATTSCGSYVLDLNQTPVNEPAPDHQRCFFQDLNLPYTEESEIHSEKSVLNDFTPICLADVHGKDSSASLASCCTSENNSRTEQEDSCEAFQMAAESLVHISATLFNQSQDFPSFLSQDKTERCVEEPDCSSDSFELHTLGILETIREEVCCVSSKAVDEVSKKKEFGVKVKRGRRMKNFQKDILPELVTLSRHEIREDINILEAVLRSKEYKNMQGKNRDAKCRLNPRNNKASTSRYNGSRRRRTE